MEWKFHLEDQFAHAHASAKSVLNLYMEGTDSWLKFYVLFLSISREMLGYCLKFGPDHFLSNLLFTAIQFFDAM
jgi:hypothetical protein